MKDSTDSEEKSENKASLSGIGEIRDDRLTVFQAAPLVYHTAKGECRPMGMLDFERERQVLTNALKDAEELGFKVDVVFETATTERFAAFLATSDSQVLHFSCHGHPKYLAIEDGWGAIHPLTVQDLKDFMRPAGNQLKVVHLSACYSRETGEAFLAAGVPHVVCCKVEERVQDAAATEFTSTFYRSLACGKTLKVAFEIARQAVRVSPSVAGGIVEMNKFMLLPEKEADDSYHDVTVFFSRPCITRNIRPKSNAVYLPRLPTFFMGRQMEMFQVLKALRRGANVVSLTGAQCIGKASVAAAVCRYIDERGRVFSYSKVYWMPSPESLLWVHSDSDGDGLGPLSDFQYLYHMLHDDDNMIDPGDKENQYACAYRRICGSIAKKFGNERVLLGVDARELNSSIATGKLTRFLQDLLALTVDVSVIVVMPPDTTGISCKNSVLQARVEVPPLSFRDSALLFGVLCPHISERVSTSVHSASEFADLLVPELRDQLEGEQADMTKRSSDLFHWLGGGIPARIRSRASSMTEEEYKSIISLAEAPEVILKFDSRAQLEEEITRTSDLLTNAVSAHEFSTAQQLHNRIGELQQLRKKFPEISVLLMTLKDLTEAMADAVAKKEFLRAKQIDLQLSALKEQISKEEPHKKLLSQKESLQEIEKTEERRLLDAKLAEQSILSTEVIQFASYQIKMAAAANKSFSLVLAVGSIVHFSYKQGRAGVVCATNETFEPQGGVYGALLAAGGPRLLHSVDKFPVSETNRYGEVKCKPGDAKLIGPGDFGRLESQYVLLAVGPVFRRAKDEKVKKCDVLLRSTYRRALEIAKEARLEAIAFSLISSGFSGGSHASRAIFTGVREMVSFAGYPELKEVWMFAYNRKEAIVLLNAAKAAGLQISESRCSSTTPRADVGRNGGGAFYPGFTLHARESNAERTLDEV